MESEHKLAKVKKSRSAAYPSLTLEEAVQALRQIHSNLGSGPYDRLSAAQALGYKGVSGASSTKIAALVHYGMLQRLGSGYQETDLGRTLVSPIDDEEERNSLITAFDEPALFNKLHKDFHGKPLPARLDVILCRQYRITEQAAEEVAKVFRQSAEFIGILNNGFVSAALSETDMVDSVSNLTVLNAEQPSEPATPAKVSAIVQSDYIPVEIGAGIVVNFPKNMVLNLATGKFTSGIQKLKENIEALEVDQAASGQATNDEKTTED